MSTSQQGRGWKVVDFTDSRGHDVIVDWLRQVRRAGSPHVSRIIRQIDLLREMGLSLPTEHLHKVPRYDVWELLATFRKNPYRILLYSPEGSTLVLLHGFLKTTNAIAESDLETAKRRMEVDRERRRAR